MQFDPVGSRVLGPGAPAPEMLQVLLSEALTLVDSDRPGARAWLDQALRMVSQSLEASEASPSPGRDPRLAPWQVKRVADFVTEHLEACIRVDELAALTRLTPGYFSKAFRGSFGLTPHAYLVERRIAWACELMLRSDEPLAQIALACGLCDQAHLTRVFRKLRGEAPAAWRRLRREPASQA